MAIRSTTPGSSMDVRIFHGNLTPNDLGRALFARFNRGNLRAQQFGSGDKAIVQIATAARPFAGGQNEYR